jgi:hypothetical protein
MRPQKPSVNHNLANQNAAAILTRLQEGCIVSLVRFGSVVVSKWTPANLPPLGHVVAALVEHQDAEAIELDTRSMKQSPVKGFKR